MNFMTAYTFVGPDGKAYCENKPEEGGFLSYFDGCKWLITFPFRGGFEKSHYFFFGDQLPSSARQWTIRAISTQSPFPAYIQACE